jgi:hypothetical protein
MHTVKNDTIEIETKSNESIVEFSENVLNVIPLRSMYFRYYLWY